MNTGIVPNHQRGLGGNEIAMDDADDSGQFDPLRDHPRFKRLDLVDRIPPTISNEKSYRNSNRPIRIDLARVVPFPSHRIQPVRGGFNFIFRHENNGGGIFIHAAIDHIGDDISSARSGRTQYQINERFVRAHDLKVSVWATCRIQ